MLTAIFNKIDKQIIFVQQKTGFAGVNLTGPVYIGLWIDGKKAQMIGDHSLTGAWKRVLRNYFGPVVFYSFSAFLTNQNTRIPSVRYLWP